MHLKDDMRPEETTDIEILRKLSPTLFEQKRSVRDAPPKGYYNQLPDKIMGRIEIKKIVEYQKPVHPYFNIRNIAIAASVAVILALIPYFKTISNSDTPSSAVAMIESGTGEKSELIEIVASTFDDADLYANLNFERKSLELPQPETDSEILINYLIDEEVSNEIIIESYN